MTISDLIAAAQVIINETAFTKNTGGRIGSLLKSITTFFDDGKVNKELGKSLMSDNEIKCLNDLEDNMIKFLN